MAFKLASVIHEKGKKVIFVDADVSPVNIISRFFRFVLHTRSWIASSS